MCIRDSFSIIGYIFAILLAHVAPGDAYHWHMSCERWRQRAIEIQLDEKMTYRQRDYLIKYLKSKVDGKCSLNFTQRRK